MAINYDWLIKGEDLLFELFKKHSSKFMNLDWLAILKSFMIFICAVIIIKVNLVATLSTSIIFCVSYLLVDILEIPVEEVVKKYREFIKRLKYRFVERHRIIHEANKVLLKEKKSLEKLVEDANKKVSLLEEKCSELSKCMSSERIAYKEWRKQETTYRKQLEVDKELLEKVLDQEVMRAEELENDHLDEMTEMRKEITFLEGVLEKEQKEKDRLEKEVQKSKAMVEETNEIIKYLQQDRDRNLNLKQVKEEMWNVIKTEIEKNAQCLSNELAQLRGSIEKTERTEVLNAEEKCDTLKSHLKKMIKQLEKLEKERDSLVEQNRVLSDKAKEDSENILLNKFEGAMDVLSAHILIDEQRTEKMLENQATLLNLLNESKSRSEGEVSSDDGYEVVESEI